MRVPLHEKENRTLTISVSFYAGRRRKDRKIGHGLLVCRRSGLPMPVAGRSLRACDCRAVAAVPASAPAYGRRARPGSQHPALRSLDASSASPSWLRVGSNAGSRGTGSPSLPRSGKAVAEGQEFVRLQRSELRCSTTIRRPGWPAHHPGCNGQDGVAAVKRRARDSNPQPISRHLISSQTASRSLTLRGRV